MRIIFYKVIFFLLMLATGCSHGAGHPILLQRQVKPVFAHFGARMELNGRSIPFCGEMNFTEKEGKLILVLPHGLVLGRCDYLQKENGMSMSCIPARKVVSHGGQILQNMGIAFHRISLGFVNGSKPVPSDESEWSTSYKKNDAGWEGVYKDDKGVLLTFNLMEVSTP